MLLPCHMPIAKVFASKGRILISDYLIGILIGKLTMELGGKVTIVCEKTRYSADIEFKLKVRSYDSILYLFNFVVF
jgi:hypothetical protein